MNKLVYLFNLVLLKTYKAKKKCKIFCPLQFWENIYNILKEEHSIKASKWSKIDKRIENKILNQTEYIITGHNEKILQENNFYLIEQVRITQKTLPYLENILKIAFSIGMFRALTNQTQIKMLNYNKFKLDKITTYLSNYDIKTLSNNIPDNLVESIDKLLDD